jgi:hypothetical protein
LEVIAEPQVSDLRLTDHACLTFGDEEELLDLTAAFFRDGLGCGHKVIWVSESAGRFESAFAGRDLAVTSALASGQLSAAGCEGTVLSSQSFAAGHALGWLKGQVDACKAGGFAGLRVAVDMRWALRPVNGVEQLPDFEERLGPVLADASTTVLCQYDRERFDPVTLASVVPKHSHSVAAASYHADAVLRICRQYAPSGIRISGEIDYRAEQPLALALAEALRLDQDITVNLAGLRFIDACCVRMIVNAARGLGPSRTLNLRCSSSCASQFILFGAADVPGVSMVTVDEP